MTPQPYRVCAIYARVSTDTQELENQLGDLRRFCEQMGFSVTREYTDVMSGKETTRPGFDMLFNHAHKKLFDVVVFWDLSRFSRAGTLYTLQKLNELEKLGIEWVSYQEQYFRSIGPFREAVLSIMATIAKIEREKISERTKAGLRSAMNVGKRGKDRRPRKVRSDRGVKRGVAKNYFSYIKKE